MGRRLSDGEETKNIKQLSDFRSYWSRSPEYPSENFGNNRVHMPVLVKYEWASGKSEMAFQSEFRAFIGSGPDDGTIDIDDCAKAKIEDFHLHFVPAFQRYTYFKADKVLVISDLSPKMGGEYRVSLTPTIQKP